ncbi:type VI secretion system lysozyme-like protein [Leclercia adecarboxylata]|uniref:Type VI secretion system lysozyme-like protein n=1 Tax=Leclercia adecarboxylata TaxID=83655 RepID=A0A4U9HWC3_9ENTR|nr:type VI secretion system lysozyme-like protein [Leclercia adecarboxylata]
MPRPSLYETLFGNFAGGLDLHQVNEENQAILSVLDNMQRIINCRAGTLAHLPDYGLPDMTKILQGMPGTAHQLNIHPVGGVAEIRATPAQNHGRDARADPAWRIALRH